MINRLIVVMVVVCLLCGCSKNKDDYTYNKYLILGKTEKQYLNMIENDLKLIYAPKAGISKNKIESIISKHMTKNCVKLFLKENSKSTVNPNDVKCDIRHINYAYGKHQDDGISRVIAMVEVRTPRNIWEFNLEMKLNESGLIYDVIPY